MATSKAKKKRQKLVREGRLNPEIKRSPFALIDLSSKQTKTKKGIYIVGKRRITKKMILFLRFFLSFHILYI